MDIDLQCLDQIIDASDHVFELYTEKTEENQDLGYVNRTKDHIVIRLPLSEVELNIKQSLSQLSSKNETSSTGFVCWRASQALVDWILSPGSLFHKYFIGRKLSVVELGTGVGGVCASVLGPLIKQYICTDQKHILKLLKENIINNVEAFDSKTIECDKTGDSRIEVVEFDWEEIDYGLYNYHELTDSKPDLIIACDTIYNEYLIPYFLNALEAFLTEANGALIGIQLRDDYTLERFVAQAIERFKLFVIPDEFLSENLKIGFVVYYIVKI
ncbi:hypothetical protein CLIB1444_01S06964 [[Candida] jaroonii]|uniref:Uncharacterized protein n=1 Tax=[Candida] jaroonii TaxID=467808 RepID=A0ACA9Y0Q6_9ASCO|nr:hypothetical protein CLIB1444_01S06964 [[Candida] jaroonii]